MLEKSLSPARGDNIAVKKHGASFMLWLQVFVLVFVFLFLKSE